MFGTKLRFLDHCEHAFKLCVISRNTGNCRKIPKNSVFDWCWRTKRGETDKQNIKKGGLRYMCTANPAQDDCEGLQTDCFFTTLGVVAVGSHAKAARLWAPAQGSKFALKMGPNAQGTRAYVALGRGGVPHYHPPQN